MKRRTFVKAAISFLVSPYVLPDIIRSLPVKQMETDWHIRITKDGWEIRDWNYTQPGYFKVGNYGIEMSGQLDLG